jgi:hypothetical protein
MRFLRRLGRRRRSRSGQPTPQEAFDALSQGFCMYAPISSCSDGLIHAGLRNDDDVNDVLVCRAHYGRLRKLKEPDLRDLERTVVAAFSRSPSSRSTAIRVI